MLQNLDIIIFVNNNNLSHIEIKLQSGPIKEVGVDGCQIDDVIFLCKEILSSTLFNKNVPSRQTALAITKLDEAIMWLEHRTKERKTRGVEGTNNA